ncbi:MAG: hypothetical protein ASARMPREDX12_007346 [Alectoria sarmentosa]|nr:MAG: hypothetical protein ASARMPREDX12_007346 [Alectoria sarmentosa]
MCRVRFGLAGVYFDSLEPIRPREEASKPLISALPPMVQNQQWDVVSKVMDCGAIKRDAVSAKESSENDEDGGQMQTAKDQIDSSSSSPRDEVVQSWAKKAKINQEPVGEGSSKAPPAKRVRFAMDVQERIIPSDDASESSSSHSSNDSYTDPPPPTEPYDAFAGYYRTACAARSHGMNRRIAGSRMRFPAEEEIDTDGADGFLDSEDGSEVDVQGLSVKGIPRRTVRAAGNGQTSDQRHHQINSTPPARSTHSGGVRDQSRVMSGGLESNVDGGLHLENSHANQKQPVSPPLSGGHLHYPKLRSGKNLPEPIFVVRPRFLSDAKVKGKPADISNSRAHGGAVSKLGHEGTKTSPPRPTWVKASKKDKSRNTGALQSATA